VGIYVTTQYAAIRDIETTVLAYRVVPLILSYLLSLLAFFLLYFVLPSTKVNPAAALWGAAVAALVWSFAKHGFSTYVTQFIPYSKIYGVLGLIPLSVFWIHITWLIALFGLQLTYTTQHLKTLDAAQIDSSKERKQEYFITNDLTVINIAREIARTFARDEGPLSCEALCNRLRLPLELGDDILEYLVKAKLLVKTSEPQVGFVPARDPEHITLSEITEALAAAALAQPDLNEPEMLGRLVQAQRRFLARHSLRDILQTEPLDGGTPGDGPQRPAS